MSKDEQRELDARVLHAAMGWRWHKSEFRGKCAILPPFPSDWDAPGVWQPSPWGPKVWDPVDHWPTEEERYSDWWNCCQKTLGKYGLGIRVGMPSPSASIADAMEALEALPDCMWQTTRYRDIARCRYTCMVRRAPHEVVSGMVDSLTLAICHAILKWAEARDAK